MEGIFAFGHRRCSSPIRELGFKTQGIMFLLNLCFFACTAFFIWKQRFRVSSFNNGGGTDTVTRKSNRSAKRNWES